ncbi:MAG: ferrochelatase [Candidatus Rokuibacteriota bacterium]|nr:MAG: ferrochelatase [Candidatus Rokubacteria bacterium]
MNVDAVLLIAFGGPTKPDEIRPFLQNVARGRRIPPERLEDVAHHYEQMPGGRSPLNDLTFMQARSLAAMLAGVNLKLPVFVGMRSWKPYLHETLATMGERGVQKAFGIILSALRTEASWERYMNDVGEARARTPGAPSVAFAPPFFDHPLFVEAVADRAGAALARVPAAERASTPLVFTAHSVPTAMANGSPYVDDFRAASAAVAKRLHHGPWRLAYQSRSGNPRDPWLEPDVNDALKDLGSSGAHHVVIVPIGFVCDHVEVLYDLDVEAVTTARAAGLTLHRATAVNDHPRFIAVLADLVQHHLEAAR